MSKLKTALILALLPIFMHADGELAMQDSKDKNKSMAEQPVPSFIEYHNRMAVFTPWHQVYERIKTDAYYGGIEAWFLPAVKSGKHSGSPGAVAEAEVRFGYNFFYNGRDHVTPFVGAGAFESFKGRHNSHAGWLGMRRHYRLNMSTLAYGVVGFLYDHEFSSVVNLGINLKGIVGGGVNKKHGDWGSAVVGFDVAVPFTLRCGRMRHWDFRIEPFNIYLYGSESWMNVFGFRSTIGYRF